MFEFHARVFLLNDRLVFFHQITVLIRHLERCTPLVVNEHILGDRLLKTGFSDPEAEIKIFKISHAKQTVQAIQLLPDMAANGNTEKITFIGRQEQMIGVLVYPCAQVQPLIFAFPGVIQSLSVARRIGHWPYHGHIGRGRCQHHLQCIQRTFWKLGVVVDQKQPLPPGQLGGGIHPTGIAQVGRALNKAQCGVWLAPMGGQFAAAVGRSIVINNEFNIVVFEPGAQALQAWPCRLLKLVVGQDNDTDQRAAHER